MSLELTTATEQQKTDIRAALGVNLSTTGGALNVPQYDVDGNLVLGPPNNNGALGSTGELKIPQFRRIAFMGPAGQIAASLYLWFGHSGGDEMIYESPRHCFYWNEGFQFGSPASLRDGRYIYIQPNSATSTDTLVESPPVSLVSRYWNGSANVTQNTWLQSRPASAAEGSERLVLNMGGAVDSNHRLSGGVEPVVISRDGIWHPGASPEMQVLTDGATVTQVCSQFRAIQVAKVTLGGNRTLAISGATSGMRGILYVRQDANGNRTLGLPTGSVRVSGFALSTGAYLWDKLEWHYDGSNYFWTIDKGLVQDPDSDAANFFARASITDPVQQAALDTLVLTLKGNGIWAKSVAIYPFVGGTAASHAENLRSTSHQIAWFNAMTHNANGITGDGVSAYGNTNLNLASLGGYQNSVTGYSYCGTAGELTAGAYLFGATLTHRFGIARSSSVAVADGPMDGELGGSLNGATGGDWRKHFAAVRSGSTAAQFYVNGNITSKSTASTGVPNGNIFLCARNSLGSAANYSNANLRFQLFGSALNSTEMANLRTAVHAFQTALGRANP
jgi:hypothetical protein